MAETGNPFYVAPLGGLDVGGKMTSILEGGRERYKEMQWEKTAPDIIKSGDPSKIADLMTQYPEKAQQIAAISGYKDRRALQSRVDMAKKVLTGEQTAQEALAQHIQVVDAQGGDTTQLVNQLGKALADPNYGKKWAANTLAIYEPESFEQFKKLTEENALSEQPADIQSFEYLTEGLEEDEKTKAKRIKLGLAPRAMGSAVQTITQDGSQEEIADTEKILAGAKEEGKKLVQLKLDPEIQSSVALAVSRANQAVKREGEKMSNEKAFNVYDTAMRGLATSLSGTTTGPGMSWIPAVTAEAQTAQGAVAAMAPVLKQLFRASGEGIFTDKDQALLMQMVPTRETLPAARDAQFKAIDAIVRAKLGIAEQPTEPQENNKEQPAPTGKIKFIGLE